MLKKLEELIYDFIKANDGKFCDTMIIHPDTCHQLQGELNNNVNTPLPTEFNAITYMGVKLTIYKSYDVTRNNIILKYINITMNSKKYI